jgi:RNA polymerase sigma-70 factor, ECF subfamily
MLEPRPLSRVVAGSVSLRRASGHGIVEKVGPRRSSANCQQAPIESAVDQSPNHARFAEVFVRHLADSYRLARWLTGSRADAEDVVQEAAIRALNGIGRFSGVNARGWVLTIVRNTAYTWLAKNRPASLVLTEDVDQVELTSAQVAFGESHSRTPEDVLIAKADAETLRRQVATLPIPFREVLVLREIHELGYKEIAEIAGVPIGTVMSRLSRARQLLVASMRGAR